MAATVRVGNTLGANNGNGAKLAAAVSTVLNIGNTGFSFS